MAGRWNGWPALTRLIQICGAISCRKFTSRCGEALPALTGDARFGPGFIAWRTTWARRMSCGSVEVAGRDWSGWKSWKNLPDANSGQLAADRGHALDRLLGLIQRLKPLDRHVILSYLEGLDAAEIGEITGLSAGNVATKIHRIKNMLARQFQQGGSES